MTSPSPANFLRCSTPLDSSESAASTVPLSSLKPTAEHIQKATFLDIVDVKVATRNSKTVNKCG